MQLTYYVAPWDAEPADVESAESPPDDVHTLRHGYNLADIDVLTRRALWRVWGLHLDYRTRYDLAWSAIVAALYAADVPPDPADLVFAGQDAIATHVRDDLRHHGRAKDGDHDGRASFARYWELPARHAHGPEQRVVEHAALWQIWPELTDAQRRALLALAAHGTYEAAAGSLGIAPKTLKAQVGQGRRRFFALWHEGEEPSTVWGSDRRVYRAGDVVQTEASYRKAMKAIRRGRKPRAAAAKAEPVHGKVGTYANHKCRCVPCTAAKTAESAARRARAGVAVRRQMTESEFAAALSRGEAGESWTAIAASLGYSEGYLRALRRGASQPVPDPAGVGPS